MSDTREGSLKDIEAAEKHKYAVFSRIHFNSSQNTDLRFLATLNGSILLNGSIVQFFYLVLLPFVF